MYRIKPGKNPEFLGFSISQTRQKCLKNCVIPTQVPGFGSGSPVRSTLIREEVITSLDVFLGVEKGGRESGIGDDRNKRDTEQKFKKTVFVTTKNI